MPYYAVRGQSKSFQYICQGNLKHILCVVDTYVLLLCVLYVAYLHGSNSDERVQDVVEYLFIVSRQDVYQVNSLWL